MDAMGAFSLRVPLTKSYGIGIVGRKNINLTHLIALAVANDYMILSDIHLFSLLALESE